MELVRNQGKIVRGHIGDWHPKRVERMLQAYDKQLYVRWNPTKNGGFGCYEIRRRPDNKKGVFVGMIADDVPAFELRYVESDLVNHVLDVVPGQLTEKLLYKLYDMDTTRVENWVDKFDYEQERSQTRLENQARDELHYQLKAHKKELQILHEEALAGRNPAHFFAGTKK